MAPRPAPPLPAWYDADDLAGFEEWCWALLARGVADRRSPFHTPSIATITPDGSPDTRTLVLRGADRSAWQFRFHTDGRAGKVAHVRSDPRVCVHFYDASQKLQLRCAGRATLIEDDDPRRNEAWAATRSFSRECYRAEPAPGSGIDAGGAYSWPDRADEGKANFAVMLVTLERLEALFLAHSGHRRAAFDGTASRWLVP